MQMKILIADDEELIGNELKDILTGHCRQAEVVFCRSGVAALRELERENFDLVFLDIQMPGVTGLDVARIWAEKNEPPLVVFVTAYSEFAVDAFAVNALDYVLKPFDEGDIERVLTKAARRLAARPDPCAGETAKVKMNCVHRITVEGKDGLEVLESAGILLIQAKNRLVYVHAVNGEQYLSRLSLQEYETRLDPAVFYRCHRNFIVNVGRIQRMTAWFNRGYILMLKDARGVQIPVSRHYVKGLKEYIDF
ncbi:MAG TPA: LytTR family DNA-binding domain-containing protein [Patescibacteria group bacterium]|nr:LytTR family DNA-binding domain-containing protein [Patescibacteria group bacterium]